MHIIWPIVCLPLVLGLLWGCASVTVRRIDFPTDPDHPTSDPAQFTPELGWAWKQEPHVDPGADGVVRLVLAGGVGVGIRPDPGTDPGAGPLRSVASAAAHTCDALGGCQLVVFLGDNLYPQGVNSPKDDRRLGQVVRAWSWIGPQLWVLGDRDWGPGGFTPPTNRRARRELAAIVNRAADYQTRGGAHFFEFSAGPIAFWALDSNYLRHACKPEPVFGFSCRGQGMTSVLDRTGTTTAPWRLALAHHPYVSHGKYGGAVSAPGGGNTLSHSKGYAGVLERTVLGRVHLVASGHDRSLQWFDSLAPIPEGGLATAQLVSGAAGKTGPRQPDVTGTAAFEAYDTLGFTVIEATEQALVVHLVQVTEQAPMGRLAYTTCLYAGDPTWHTGTHCETARRVAPAPSDPDAFQVPKDADPIQTIPLDDAMIEAQEL